MRTTFILIITALAISGCTNTRKGLSEDSERFGEKMQEIGQILSGP